MARIVSIILMQRFGIWVWSIVDLNCICGKRGEKVFLTFSNDNEIHCSTICIVVNEKAKEKAKYRMHEH